MITAILVVSFIALGAFGWCLISFGLIWVLMAGLSLESFLITICGLAFLVLAEIIYRRLL